MTEIDINIVIHSSKLGINVQPDPVRFNYLNSIDQPYKFPPNCHSDANGTTQVCDNPEDKWSYVEWIFTAKHHCFGLIHGAANPTGVFSYLILLIIVLASLPFVRRSGKFEVNKEKFQNLKSSNDQVK